MNIMNKAIYGQRGFTLIELLIVIAILGILSAVAIPNVSAFMNSGKIAAANSELLTVSTANQGYAGDHGGTNYLNIVSGTALSNYIHGNIKGTYYFNPGGLVTNAAYPGANWDSSKGQFVKP